MAESRPETRSGSEDEKTMLQHETGDAVPPQVSDDVSSEKKQQPVASALSGSEPQSKKRFSFFSRKKAEASEDDDEKKETAPAVGAPPAEHVRDAVGFFELFR